MPQQIFGFDVENKWDYENGYYLTSDFGRLAKAIAHYELYKSIVGLPGQIIECGVYKGASLIRFATYREILESPVSRKIIGFDAFGAFPAPDGGDDIDFVRRFEADGGDGISEDEMRKVLSQKGFQNFELIRGDVIETIPSYLERHSELKIALLHVDVDVYQPTVAILEHLFDRVVRGGVVVFDDYSTVAGETNAVDEFLDGTSMVVEKLPISHVPSFVRKA